MTTQRAVRRRLLATAAALTLAGCGFRLRGARPLPFASVQVTGAVGGDLARRIRKRIEAGGTTRVVSERKGAEAVLELTGAGREKNIIGLSGAGKVREYEFVQHLRFRLLDGAGRELIPETRLSATREATWDDSAILAKDQEEALLFSDMEDELVRQLMRRLEAARREG
ncbi:MAG: hypothetical protein KDG52_08100 [Rhodocyclaceae bacterium]|nr:hypothetical protein [Rhodocyclaceae bacterium]